ncbi:MAG: cytochrome c4 [Desulfovibrionaceae bacterium]|jgi:cytochrome c553|nr:cytochrome c4 [Desulfovibrionaceae bacterium]
MKLLAALLTASLLSASAFAADAPAAPQKPDLEKGKASFGAVCNACHAEDGNSIVPLQPNLAQQHPEYLIKQLTEFKSGARQDPTMQAMVATLATDDDVRNVAWWLASQKAKPAASAPEAAASDAAAAPADAAASDAAAPPSPAQLALGERIYRGGIQDRRIAACAGCHGPSGAGIPSQYPRLSGQHVEYTVKQLVAFRDETRTNNLQMTGVAAKLNDREIKAVAGYIATLLH